MFEYSTNRVSRMASAIAPLGGLVLKLSSTGSPLEWITQKEAARLICNEKVSTEVHTTETIRLYGGTQNTTNSRSFLTIPTIVGLSEYEMEDKDQKLPRAYRELIFIRDGYRCGYCDIPVRHPKKDYIARTSPGKLRSRHATVDHIIPQAQGGTDEWENLITACRHCNLYKADRTPEEASMELLRRAKIPSYSEYLKSRNSRATEAQKIYLERHM